ncbi:glycerophosphodiester phosphodiesterase [Candidatus Woesearchaeota archaeon]|nr:glycerophosphodiester phosphodiesterase [Candidatus Woesearchaeota archaeon]
MTYLRMSHRANCPSYTENTLEAFEAVCQKGVHIFETDIRLTKDKVPVIFHDATLQRLCKDPRKLAEMTLREWKQCSTKEMTFISLEELFEHFKGKKVLFDLELKEDVVTETLRVIEKYKKEESVIISSYYPHLLHEVKKQNVHLTLGLLANHGEFIVTKALKYHANVVIIHTLGLRKYHIVRAHKQGMSVWTWPVNTKRLLRKLEAWGIDGVMTDNPELFN